MMSWWAQTRLLQRSTSCLAAPCLDHSGVSIFLALVGDHVYEFTEAFHGLDHV